MTAAIEAHNLRRVFGENEAVAGVDLAVKPSEIYGFLGPNGAGKSTMVKMLCTLLTPTSGRATVAGFDVASQASDIRLRIGVALQDSSIDGKQSGREMLHLQGELYGLSKSDITQRLSDVIGLVDIGSAIDDRVETYSGGMKRRLDLAMSLIHKPQILFLDEPTTGLHFEDIGRLLTVLQRLVDQGNTVLVIEHNLDVIKTADWIIDLGPNGGNGGGQIVAQGTPEDVAKVKESFTGQFLAPLLS